MTMDSNASAGPQPMQPADFDPATDSRRLLRKIRSCALATLTQSGGPFVSLTAIATDYAGNPILLLSRLAVHTRNLERDGRCSLLLAQGGRGDPLAHPRLTLEAIAERINDQQARDRFLRRNPKAALYADFPDFSFWSARITSLHLNGGFARAADLEPRDVLTPFEGAETLLAAEADILDHLNGDHADTLALLAQKLGEAAGAWRASGLDPEGLDLLCGDASARLPFPTRVETPDAVRDALIELARRARATA
jgi:heme iron utilization protein